jgi:hypothetical protein
MKSANVFDDADFENLRKRIQSLGPHYPRKWGKMNLCQMLMHCNKQIDLARGLLKTDRMEGHPMMRSGLSKWLLFYVIPWPKGASTPSNMETSGMPTDGVQLNQEKEKLLKGLEEVRNVKELGIHPFFGRLSHKEWGRLIWKHMDHHLKQFSA